MRSNCKLGGERVHLTGHQRASPWGNANLGPLTMSTHNMYLQGDHMDLVNHEEPKLLWLSGGLKGIMVLERCHAVTQLEFPGGSRAQLVLHCVSGVCHSCNHVFHGVVKYMISGPNNLAGNASVVTSWDPLQGHAVWGRMVLIWVPFKNCIMFLHWERPLVKKKVNEVYTLGSWELQMGSSRNVWFFYFLSSLRRSFDL